MSECVAGTEDTTGHREHVAVHQDAHLPSQQHVRHLATEVYLDIHDLT